MDIIKEIRDYVDDLFSAKLAEYRFNPVAIDTTFKAWGDRSLQDYKSSDPIRHTTFRDFLEAMDRNYAFQITESTDEILNRIKWATPTPPAPGDPEDDRAIGVLVQHLVITGATVQPGVATVTPLDPTFHLDSEILEGCLALNSTDDIWYYRVGNTIKKLVDTSTFQIAVSQITDYNIPTVISALDGRVGANETSIGAINTYLNGTLAGKLTGYDDHLANTAIHREVDGVTILINPDGKMEAQVPVVDLSDHETRIAALELTVAAQEDRIAALEAIGGGSIDTSDFILKNPLNGATQTINGKLIVANDAVATGDVTAYG